MANPVLINDLRKSLIRRKPVNMVALMAIVILVLTLISASAMQLDITGMMKAAPVWNFPDLLLPVVVPAFASGSFAREHEQRTWDDVLLTRLGAWEIIRGKFLACMIPSVTSIIVMFPAFIMLLMVWGISWALDLGPWILIALIKFLISAFFYISLVMLCSYFCNNGRTALVASYVLLAGYALANYIIWFFLANSIYDLLMGVNSQSTVNSTSYGSFGSEEAQHFSLSPMEIAHTIQSLIFGTLCLLFLRWRLGKRD